MKVGTDGCLLGAWADVPGVDVALTDETDARQPRILDVGTGTGVIALMMAQRFPEARLVAIDIDGDAVSQAAANVADSIFASRITVQQADFSLFTDVGFSAVVCNPPYFVGALECPDPQRSLARHADTLNYDVLARQSFRVLLDGGELSVVVPVEALSLMQTAVAVAGFLPSRQCAVRTTPSKPPRRYLLSFRKPSAPDVSHSTFHAPYSTPDALRNQQEIVIGSAEYAALMRDFYLKM